MIYCSRCSAEVADDEGPCPSCGADLEISAVTELPCRVKPSRWLTRLWLVFSKNWPVHNLIAHPVSELLYWVGLGAWGNWLHDYTVPPHEEGTGRG